jgi:predicted DNA-binding protein
MKAQEQARDLGDEKLTDQIGNTITYFTRAHVARNVSEMDDMDVNVNTTEMEAELGLDKPKTKKLRKTLTNQCFQCGIKSNNNL